MALSQYRLATGAGRSLKRIRKALRNKNEKADYLIIITPAKTILNCIESYGFLLFPIITLFKGLTLGDGSHKIYTTPECCDSGDDTSLLEMQTDGRATVAGATTSVNLSTGCHSGRESCP